MKYIASDKKKKVIAALSGGVDSAVSAALLKKQGFEIVGAYFRLGNFSRKSEIRVKKIAKKIGIPLKIVDARKEFKKRVINYFINSYKSGLTPNPCVVCNKEIKFRLLFDLMKKYKADYVATGHYAQITKQSSAFPFQELSSWNSSKPSFIFRLLQAKDKTKDQSYFLYKLTQKDLTRIIFPLGEYKKSEVKKIAKKMKLPVHKIESQDICFVANNDVAGYLAKYISLLPGNIVDGSGKILGRHKGLPIYTLGQRKGIEIGPPASRQEREAIRASGTGPFWVLGKNIRKNELIVSNNPKDALLWSDKFYIIKTNWINKNQKFPLKAQVKIRYHAPSFPAIINKIGSGKWEVRSGKKLRAVTSGQSAVIYKNGEVLGGGIIN